MSGSENPQQTLVWGQLYFIQQSFLITGIWNKSKVRCNLDKSLHPVTFWSPIPTIIFCWQPLPFQGCIARLGWIWPEFKSKNGFKFISGPVNNTITSSAGPRIELGHTNLIQWDTGAPRTTEDLYESLISKSHPQHQQRYFTFVAA